MEKSGIARGRRFNKCIWLLMVLTPFLFLLATGCHRDEIKVYRVAKDQDQTQQPTGPALSTDTPNPGLPLGHPDVSSANAASFPTPSGLPQLTWKTPDGWTEVPPGEMRVASFKITGTNGKQADVSVIPLPGQAGSDEANVNRWRGQVGLPPLPPDELKKSAQDVEAGGQSAQLYDIPGQNPGNGNAERILAAIQRRADMAWFFKMTGDSDLVEQQKPAFIAFLKSLAFGAPQTPTGMPPSHPAIGDMGMGMSPAAASGPISHEGQPNWEVPAGWQEVPGGQFLIAKFNISGPSGAATVNVSSSPGEGGGQLANLNRWREQLGLEPLTKEIPPSRIGPPGADIPAAGILTVDYTGTDSKTGQPARLVGSIVQQNGQTWFYKLMGDPKIVESQKAAFTKFVQGAKYQEK